MSRFVLWSILAALVALPALGSAQSPAPSRPGGAARSQPPAAAVPASVQDEPSGGMMSRAGTTLKDSWITSKLKSKLLADKRVKVLRIKVETDRAVVTLRGKVATVDQRRAAEEIARSTDGVASVTNLLQVVPEEQRKAVDARDEEIEDTIRAQFDKDQALKDIGVAVRSDNGMVTLLGSVPDGQVRARVADLTRRVPGVRSVRNETRVKK